MSDAIKIDATNPVQMLGALMPEGANDYCPKLIGASIRSIASAGKKLDVRIHTAAVAIIYRSMADYDCSLATNLVNAMPRSARSKALMAWFEAFSNVRFKVQEDKSYRAHMLKPTHKDYKDARPQDAFDKPFYSVEEAKPNPKAFDDKAFVDAIASLLKRAEGENAKLSPAALAKLADLKIISQALAPAE